MAKSKAIPKKILLSRLEQWSFKNGIEGDPYVASVTQAINTSSSLDFWSSLNPEEHLPRPQATSGSNQMKLAKYSAILRNVTVFLPVGITWKAISEATTTFAQFTSTNAAAPVNFLEFWQNGYGFLDPKWRIGHVAELDFWIIIAVIALTIMSTTFHNIGRTKAQREQELLDKERKVLSLELQSYFSAPRSVSKKGVDESLAKALRNLTSATEAIALAAANLRTSVRVQPELQEIQGEVTSFHKRLGSILKGNRE
jgi:hypothetical protein